MIAVSQDLKLTGMTESQNPWSLEIRMAIEDNDTHDYIHPDGRRQNIMVKLRRTGGMAKVPDPI
jgi:hypothetical protein